ncbi:MAG TPA: leucine-rich repeat domain-containing protein [Pirellulales bacterium]|nr:leucine-rich repeat domain-containing protein [Pirellulales bacterium]
MTRRFQFSLKALFILTFFVSLPYGWHAWRQAQFAKPYRRINAFRALGGTCDTKIVTDDREDVPGDGAQAMPRFYLTAIHLGDSRMTDKDMPLIEPVTTLRTLDLSGTKITDASLKCLWGLKKLKLLDLRDTPVTDSGVADLQKRLPDCEISR